MSLLLDKTIVLSYPDFEVLVFFRLRVLKEKIDSFLRALSKKQTAGLAVFIFLVATLPLAVMAVRYEAYKRSRALQSPLTPPITPPISITPTPSPTGFGLAARFNGTIHNPDYIEIPDNPGLVPYPNFTIEAWIKPDLPASPVGELHRSHILTKKVSNGDIHGNYSNAYGLSYHYKKITEDYFEVSYSFSVRGGPNTSDCQSGSSSYTTMASPDYFNKWRHIAGVIHDRKLKLFIDGKLMNTNQSYIFEGNFCSGNHPLQIGSGPVLYHQYHETNPNFQGEIDEIRQSSLARYTADFSLPTTPFTTDIHTVAIWHLDGNAKDSSGGGVHNGQIINNVQFVPSTVPTTGCQAVDDVVDVYPVGGSGTCHDIQQAINVASASQEVHVHSGSYEVPIQTVDDLKVGLHINKKIVFEADYPNTIINIRRADYGILFDKADVSLSGWKINFQDIKYDGIRVVGGDLSRRERYAYLGVLELTSEGSVPTLLHIVQLKGQTNSGGGKSGIFESKFTGAEKAAIELDYVEDFNISKNSISNSTYGIYNSHAPLYQVYIEENNIQHVRSGITLSGQNNVYLVRQTYLRKNEIVDFGKKEDYQDEATKYHLTSLGAINLSYPVESAISSNLIKNGGGTGILLEGGGNVIVDKNVLENIEMSIGMSGGNASFQNNTIYGNENKNGGGNLITKHSSFLNNIVANVGSYRTEGLVSNQCGLTIVDGTCDDFNSDKISNNDFFNNERIYCSPGSPIGQFDQCEFTYGVNGNISADPLFGPDFCLMPGSPAIGMGAKGLCQDITPTPTPVCVPYTCEPGSWTEEELEGFADRCWRKTTPECLVFDHNCDGQIRIDDIQYIASHCLLVATPTPSPEPDKANLTFKVKFESIDEQRPDKTVEITLQKENAPSHFLGTLPVSGDKNGVYAGTIISVIPDTYDILVKGWVHLQKKFTNIILNQGSNTQDWSEIELLAGDANGDNKVNIQDLGVLARDYHQSESPADFNLDGIVNIQDFRFIAVNYRQEGDN
jgi:hypothetical protein